MATLVGPISVLAAHFNRIYGHVITTLHLLRFPRHHSLEHFPHDCTYFQSVRTILESREPDRRTRGDRRFAKGIHRVGSCIEGAFSTQHLRPGTDHGGCTAGADGPFSGTSRATRSSTQSSPGRTSLVWGVPTGKLLALEGRGSAGGDSARCSGLASSYVCVAMETAPHVRGQQPSVRHVRRIPMGCWRISSVPCVPTASFGAEQLCSHTRFTSVVSGVCCCSAPPVCARAVFVAALGQSQYGKAAPPIPARATRQWQVRASPHTKHPAAVEQTLSEMRQGPDKSLTILTRPPFDARTEKPTLP